MNYRLSINEYAVYILIIDFTLEICNPRTHLPQKKVFMVENFNLKIKRFGTDFRLIDQTGFEAQAQLSLK